MNTKEKKVLKTQYRLRITEKNKVKNISVLHKRSGSLFGLRETDHWIDRETFHQPFELLGVDLFGFFGIARPGKMTAFHTLGKEKESITFPEKSLDLVGAPATEEEKDFGSEYRQLVT
jgi:hypothetical protein